MGLIAVLRLEHDAAVFDDLPAGRCAVSMAEASSKSVIDVSKCTVGTRLGITFELEDPPSRKDWEAMSTLGLKIN